MMIKENIVFIFGIAAISVFFLINLFGFNFHLDRGLIAPATAATSVSVTATVNSTITCTTDIATTAFGVLSSSAVATSSPAATTTMTCANAGAGCVLSVQDTGTSSGAISGLAAEPASAIIESPVSLPDYPVSALLAAGTEGFGLQTTTTAAGSGATLTLAARFSTSTNWDTFRVSGVSTTAVTLATANSSTSSRQVKIQHMAAISASTLAGSYKDTITYQCVVN